ncbi:MAG: tRNA uridine-5-carboxymethylaminomethyl(34) synthesis GTPase MnmE [Clostridiales bacterium]|nr:tRNA uridine-5-carboxymethylaminomethyl(34) synthesis GTPase MnmE [Clostridiales bacterium]MDD7035908.1 tRNA uridine-5-carboxymethylaminomethyl(34) synthesis GTPase MnmE [Bacillota bacterium]MDY2920509.1 tRNA uridine-5-carboxymethylaminomethyl(34) synthesis GTPase MnmE [Lentihominibacter sp.]
MNDTIAAIATAAGEGGIGIVRISGPEALETALRVFRCKGSRLDDRRMTYGHVVEPGGDRIIDEALAVYMKGPASYTGDDVVEINCHGSMVSLRRTLQAVLRSGARMAEPGEFTKTAFLNGRMDLSQAEAVIDVIKARTDKSFDVAMSQLEGGLSLEINRIRNSIMDLLVEIAVNIDYPDEDIEQIVAEGIINKISTINDMIEKLLSGADTGRIVREGLSMVIVGKPNVGKSSLMNALLRETRAIVTEIPGTTRDTIEEALSIRGIPVYLTDTAGIRETDDIVEKIGIEKTKDAFNKADTIILILDASSPLTEEDEMIIEHIGDRKCFLLLNKQDRGSCLDRDELKRLLPEATVIETVLTSGEGISELEDKIEEQVYSGRISRSDDVLVNNVRHIELLHKAEDSLKAARKILESGEAMDFAEIDIREAYEVLGEITGDTVSEDIIDEVFARFCLGK